MMDNPPSNHHFLWENPLYMVIFNSYFDITRGYHQLTKSAHLILAASIGIVLPWQLWASSSAVFVDSLDQRQAPRIGGQVGVGQAGLLWKCLVFPGKWWENDGKMGKVWEKYGKMGKIWEKYGKMGKSGKSMGTWWCYTREWYEMHWATMGKWRAELSNYGWAWEHGIWGVAGFIQTFLRGKGR